MVKKYLGGDNGYFLAEYLRKSKKEYIPPFVKLLKRQKAKEKKNKRRKKFSTDSFGFILNKYKNQNKRRRNK